MRPPRRKKLVIAGNGMAAGYLLSALGEGHDWDIQVLGEEPVHYYNRIMLSPLLGGETDLDAISPRDTAWYRRQGIRVSLGSRIMALCPETKTLHCADGKTVNYDRLVLATGSRSALPPLPGAESLAGVSGFRCLDDVHKMQRWCREHPGEPVVVIGGGLLGVEAAVGLRRLGVDVTLVHRRPVLMNRQLDAHASSLLAAALRERGIRLETDCRPLRLLGENRVSGVEVSSGGRIRTFPASLVVCATGITPNAEIAADAGLDCDRGVLVDRTLTTSDASIHALGECCQFGATTYGLVAPIQEQARVLAARLNGKSAVYAEPRHVTRLKVSGLDIHSMGVIEPGDRQQALWLSDARDGVYIKVLVENDRLCGALLVGDVRLSQWHFDLLVSGTDISDLRDQLLLGAAPGTQTHLESSARVA